MAIRRDSKNMYHNLRIMHIVGERILHMVVPGRSQTLFRCILRLHYRIQSAVVQNFH